MVTGIFVEVGVVTRESRSAAGPLAKMVGM